jgi:hypothetical protein
MKVMLRALALLCTSGHGGGFVHVSDRIKVIAELWHIHCCI